MVMLTLTADNVDQVLPLAGSLRGRVDLFTFNRLSQVGEGAELAGAPIENYPRFLDAYLDALPSNPHLGLKDSLLNLRRHQRGERLFGGCAGYGCGAAFNFVALTPDGEVHACRKFPSPLGNIFTTPLEDIYVSPLAQRYRLGPEQCRACPVRPVCGSCPAVIHSHGLDIFTDRDPHCFLD